MQKKLQYILLALIVLGGFILRIYNINGLPATLNPDEASLGYNAFSILRTGTDEHGVKLPLALQAFGDWKLPVYSYLDAISIFFLGVSKLSVRLPSILAGTGMIILIYFVSLEIFRTKKIALLSSLFLAINPWSVFFSRGAYEVNAATFIFLGGFLLMLLFLRIKKVYLLFFSFLCFGVSMFTQHNYILFVPLFVVITLLTQRKKYRIERGFLAAALFLAVLIICSYVSLFQGGARKASNLSVFNSKAVLYERSEKIRGDNAVKYKLIDKILYNKVYAGVYQFSLNYFSAYSSEILFDHGGARLTHNLGDIGYFYIIDAGLFLSGLFFLIWKREKRILLLLLPWFLIVPIPSAVTTEHTGTRLFTMVPVFILITSYGAYSFIDSIKSRKLQLVAGLGVAGLVLISFIYFANFYFVHFNTQRMSFWRYGYEDAVKIALLHKDYKIVIRGPENFPYIYFLLYDKYDPITFRKEVSYLPPTKEGLLFVSGYGRYKFVSKIDYKNLHKKTIYFDDQVFKNNYPALTLPSGDVIMKYHIVN